MTRSLNRAPTAISRSHFVTPKLDAFVPCIPSHTRVKLIGAVKSTFSHQAVCNRCVYFLYKLHAVLWKPRMSRHRRRQKQMAFALSLISSSCLCQIFFFDSTVCCVLPGTALLFTYSVICGGHIFCDIDQNRTRSAFLCNAECFTDGICQFCDVFYNIVMLW